MSRTIEWFGEISRRVRMLMRRSEFDSEMDEEMRLHRQMKERELVEAGESPEDARYAARRKVGNTLRLREESREAWGWAWLENLLQDLRYATRMLRKSPGFTIVAALTLALGIGANTAIFSLIDTVMLRMLSVQHPEELVQVNMQTPGFGNGARSTFTNPLWEELRDRQDVFSGLFAWDTTQFNLSESGVADNVRGVFASGDYFQALGIRPAAGRLLTPDDDKRGCPGIAVLSYGFWQDHFGGAPSAVGTTIPLDARPFEIVGVSAHGFFGTEVGTTFDVAVPICAEAILTGKESDLDKRSSWGYRVMGRARAGVTKDALSARLAVLSPPIFAATVPTNWNPKQQASFRNWRFTTSPAATGISSLRRQYDLPLKMLMGIAALVLLIACANIASLMLARASARRKEIAVRLALGASRRRLIRQLLTECLLLSGIGAAFGLWIARAGGQLLVRYISTEREKVVLDLALDGRILFFTAAIAILTGVLFGLLPAFRATRVSVSGGIKGSANESSAGAARFRSGSWTVAVQVAISLVLVITAGLFVRSFAKLATLDAGFDRANVLVADMDTHNAGLTDARQAAVADEILRRVRALPGVVSASRAIVTPIGRGSWDNGIVVEGPQAPTGQDADVYINFVAPDFFSTLRTPLLEGRDFGERDAGETPRVAIINQALARKFFPGSDPLGKSIRTYGTATTLTEPIEIVGIVHDSKYASLREDFEPIAYFPLAEIPGTVESSHLVIRTAVPPAAIEPEVQSSIGAVNKSISLEFHVLAEQVDESITQERLLATLSGFFGGLALLLATIGLYGLLAFLVLERQKEIGIRMALGAQRSTILRLVVSDVARLLFTGIVAGVAIAWATTRFVQSLLFGLQAQDAGTIAWGIALLAGVAFVAACLPARRAMRVDPMVALRYE